MEYGDIILLHAYGQSAFSSEEIIAYGSLDNLMASDLLAGIPNREKSLMQLWEAAQSIANAQSDTATQEPTEEA